MELNMDLQSWIIQIIPEDLVPDEIRISKIVGHVDLFILLRPNGHLRNIHRPFSKYHCHQSSGSNVHMHQAPSAGYPSLNAHPNTSDSSTQGKYYGKASVITNDKSSASIEGHPRGLRPSVPKLSTLARQCCKS